VKVHRGELADEGIDILADKVISDLKAGKEWCRRTNRAVFTWKNHAARQGKSLIKIVIRHSIIA